jgi:hypothetical protein
VEDCLGVAYVLGRSHCRNSDSCVCCNHAPHGAKCKLKPVYSGKLPLAQERAWVGLASTPQVQVSPLKQKQFVADITLSIQNFGKGPAFNVFSNAFLATHGHAQESQNAACNLIFPFVGVQPSSPVSASVDISKTQWGEMLFPTQAPAVHGINWSGQSSDVLGQEVFVVGCIVYKDQFASPHWIRFSYSTGPFAYQVVRDPSAFLHLYISTGNNYTDDTEKKPS